jgi:L-lactate dehydrogenase
MQGGSVGIVGTGQVGMAAAAALFHSQVVSRITLVDLDHRRAQGEAMDLMHGQALVGACGVRAGSYDDLAGAQVVVVSAGVAQKPGESRRALLARNLEVFRDIARQLDRSAPQAVVLVATNPVDVLTLAFQNLSSRPGTRVIGTGTLLDTARLRALLGEHYGVDPQSVHAYVLGEHGDSEFIPWTLATIGGVPILGNEVLGTRWDPPGMDRLGEQVRRAAYDIIDCKGYTNWAIGAVIMTLTSMVLRNERAVVPVSVRLRGEYGLSGPCCSLPARVGSSGVEGVGTPPLSEPELAQLRQSVAALSSLAEGIELG